MAGKSNGAETMQDWARAPPAALPFGKRFANFLYNPEDKSVLGRTPKRWGIVLTFYLCFYAVLAALFAACYVGLMRNIDKLTPHFTLTESLIGANPGVAFRPRNDVTGVLTYDVANTTALEKDIEAFLKTYEHEAWYINATECKARDNYGLPNTPCFFIKLNKIFDWEPQYYDGDKIPLPAEMPEDLKAYIMSSTQRKQIWMSCEEEKKNVTQISYPWGRGLPEIYFPYRNAPGYRSPLLAVKVTPPTEESTEIIIRCRMWAANIHYDKSIKEARGYARIVFKITNTLSAS